ncbi:hypothetical protein KSP40_PGU022068 [Platanthera guangdongensis]|uniref:Transposase (putative) gypsy type domain-containing protein n=1 Tax=Platanthera guangdongensis TaxID=2320717 RepID=A0ABR2N2S0_9ASPA
MGGGGGDVDGRSKCAGTFSEHDFPRAIISEREYLEALGDHIPAGFSARRPGEGEKINDLSGNELSIPLAHFEVGLRLPLWPEVRQALKYFGVVPGQMTPNSVAIMVGFACFLREERVEFNLAVFRKLFSFRANRDGTAYFSSAHLKVRETVNKSHNWLKRFLFIKGDFGNVPFSPVQLSEASYRPPSLGGHEPTCVGSSPGRTSRSHTYAAILMTSPQSHQGRFATRHCSALPSSSLPHLLSWQASGISLFILPTRALGLPPRFSPERRPRMPLSATPRRSRPRSGRAVDSPLPRRKWRRLRASNPLRAKGKARPRLFCWQRIPLPWSLRPATSAKPVPRGHRNFGYGERYLDELGVPLLSWDKESNRAMVSTLLPSWMEQDTIGGEAYNFSFGLYSREDAAIYDKEETRVLVHESARAQLRGLELAHMVGRRCTQLERNATSLKKLADEREEAQKLAQEDANLQRRRADAAEDSLAQYLGGVVCAHPQQPPFLANPPYNSLFLFSGCRDSQPDGC